MKTRDDFIKDVATKYLMATEMNKSLIHNWKELREYNHYKFAIINRYVDVVFTNENPYKSYSAMRCDISQNHRLKIFTGNCKHPVWSKVDNCVFRAVHDYFGHYRCNQPFSFDGEIKVYLEHIKDMTCKAQVALMTELVGELCYYFYFKQYPPSHKICDLTQFSPELLKIA